MVSTIYFVFTCISTYTIIIISYGIIKLWISFAPHYTAPAMTTRAKEQKSTTTDSRPTKGIIYIAIYKCCILYTIVMYYISVMLTIS